VILSDEFDKISHDVHHASLRQAEAPKRGNLGFTPYENFGLGFGIEIWVHSSQPHLVILSDEFEAISRETFHATCAR
jgi:hypothetical protein